MTDNAGRATRVPLRLAIVNDYEVIVAGLHHMLAPFDGRIEVIELDSQLPVESEVDVVLYDAFSRERAIGPVETLIHQNPGKVVVYSWHTDAELIEEALGVGVAGWVSKSVEAEDLVAALEAVRDGAVVVCDVPAPDTEVAPGAWPGKEHGLSPRESEVLALIAQGLTNQEIADRAYLSINSVKTYIRAAYRKIGVARRTQALLWATKNGFLPSTKRMVVQSPEPGGDRLRR
ncbi:MAG: response regulator transcription factor [Nocardioides sp.]